MSADTHEALKRLAEETRQPVSRVLEQLVRQAEARRLWEQYAEANGRLHGDPQARAAHDAEQRLWSAADADGLDPNEGKDWSEELRDAAAW